MGEARPPKRHKLDVARSFQSGGRALEAQDAQYEDQDSTDLRLATLASLHPNVDQEALLDLLIAAEGSVDTVSQILNPIPESAVSPRKRPASSGIGRQSSLSAYRLTNDTSPRKPGEREVLLTRKGQTLHLYTPEDIAAHTPCSIIHNFLPTAEADDLLKELLAEAQTYEKASFKVFDNVVQSPHSACFYVDGLDEQKRQKTEYLYNGSFLEDVRQITPQMSGVAPKVKDAVNSEVKNRITAHYPDGKKLKYQSPRDWVPNAAFVNCYNGGAESVGYHCDQLTYVGPRAIIGSLSLGVAREFRVRRTVPKDDEELGRRKEDKHAARADVEGQIAIHLPHNSLLVMHAEMQEEWKHSIHPVRAIDPHPIAGNRRINVTYRYYRDEFHPRYTPRCNCKVATVLRCVQKKKENCGRYMWMCHAGLTPGKEGCSFFQWAEFDDDGNPPWTHSTQP